MSKAREIADNIFDPRQSPDNYLATVSAIDEALEWAAQQCELEAPMLGSDQSLVANACAERIRAGKSK